MKRPVFLLTAAVCASGTPAPAQAVVTTGLVPGGGVAGWLAAASALVVLVLEVAKWRLRFGARKVAR